MDDIIGQKVSQRLVQVLTCRGQQPIMMVARWECEDNMCVMGGPTLPLYHLTPSQYHNYSWYHIIPRIIDGSNFSSTYNKASSFPGNWMHWVTVGCCIFGKISTTTGEFTLMITKRHRSEPSIYRHSVWWTAWDISYL
jgi:hypothetical protein